MIKSEPSMLHIDLGNQSLMSWLKENKYIIYSELVRYCEIIIKDNLESTEAIMVSNLSDNIVFLVKKENAKMTLEKAMEYFLSIEEYEQCDKIQNCLYLLKN
jgi:predicted acyltransferase (DUF342 family)